MIRIQITARDRVSVTVRPGVWVQLRDRELTARELLAYGRTLREQTAAVGAKLLVNDRLDLALVLRADGMHLGRTSIDLATVRQVMGPDAIITKSAHTPGDVLAAAKDGADAALLSPIFASPGKAEPLGAAAISQARHLVGPDFAIVALGGVTRERIARCIEAGASGVAAIRADLG